MMLGTVIFKTTKAELAAMERQSAVDAAIKAVEEALLFCRWMARGAAFPGEWRDRITILGCALDELRANGMNGYGNGYDCSKFIQNIMLRAAARGVEWAANFPRSTKEQLRFLSKNKMLGPFNADLLLPGDLVYWEENGNRRGHVALYIGFGMLVDNAFSRKSGPGGPGLSELGWYEFEWQIFY